MTISICMIVKNEEKVLARCLDSIADLVDEIIIVDTGSTDNTKQIAHRYTDKVYDFEWINDFSAARNFAFSHATSDYIYSADADEVLDEENRIRFKTLKDNLLPEIEIVQMKYGNQLSHGTVYNFDEEYRPKLFKRLRSFVWIEPVHEMVRLDPVVFDSDIVITHMPLNNHSGRDFSIFLGRLNKGEMLSERLWEMYARELYLCGEEQDFAQASKHFEDYEKVAGNQEHHQVIALICMKAARLAKDMDKFFKYSTKLITGEGCSELCVEMGLYYEEKGDYDEALIWFYNAAYEIEPVLSIAARNQVPFEHMAHIYEQLHQEEQAQQCREMIKMRNEEI